eukprot:TRINITY_DN180_c2_g1_i1.p1 TRINITY_DN180_c2_g1~~TRINITY_DN180_c2_g1_i1.p1  ORF type:complete len:689 (-),score=250.82 TRINITY_DN180_c2_g1_i1:82-2148(-)
MLKFFVAVTLCVGCIATVPLPGFRAPAVPLIQNDPYMNIWSMSDNLYDTWPALWDGTIKALSGIIRIDGSAYRFMGPADGRTLPNAAIPQLNVTVLPTRTVYVFGTSSVQLSVTFATPTVPTDFDLLSMPVTYITYDVVSVDGGSHDVQLYYDNSGEIVTNDCSTEQIAWNRTSIGGLLVSQFGTTAQAVLGMHGDGVGINWGYHYAATADDGTAWQVNSVDVTARQQFASTGTVPTSDDGRQPRLCSDNWPVQATAWNLGAVGPTTPQRRVMVFAYDDVASIDYFGLFLPPFWRRNGASAFDMLLGASSSYSTIMATLAKQDAVLLTSLNASGGAEYATLTSLAFRQAYAGTKLVWHPKLQTAWVFLKEISSCGCLQTADVIYPAAPLYLWQNAQFVQLLLVPLLAYANNETDILYNLPWAPHHLGQYPIGNIQPSQQENMPVEETANLIILMAAVVQQQHTLDMVYPHYWPLVQSWAQYLVSVLPDPGNQLCTDDFEGPSPHNVNLAAKGIIGLQAYAYLCSWLNFTDEAAKYTAIVNNFSAYWVQNANDGNHSRLQYNLPNSWSLKYNMLFQRVLGFDVFPDAVIQQDLQYYLQNQQNVYGVPLDIRATFTKLDWEFWMAALTVNADDFNNFVNPIYKWAHETQSRVPLTDWYDTISGNQRGFQARPVVGGLFSKSLVDNSRDKR